MSFCCWLDLLVLTFGAFRSRWLAIDDEESLRRKPPNTNVSLFAMRRANSLNMDAVICCSLRSITP